jgi:hypothetical protein
VKAPLTDARLTFKRAEYHIRDFKRGVKRFVHGKQYVSVPDDDTESGERGLKLRLKGRLPVSLPSVFADAVHNLRVALDQAVSSVSTGDPKFMSFPFADNEAGLSKFWPKGRSGSLSADLFTVLCDLKPHKGGDAYLWSVHELDVRGKHRRLVQLRPYFDPSRPDALMGKTAALYRASTDTPTGELKVEWLDPSSDAYFDFEYSPFVRVEEIEGVPILSASALLDRMAGKVTSALEVNRLAAGPG